MDTATLSAIIGNTVTALCYFLIPYHLIVFVRKRSDIPFTSMWLLFGAFIASCGIGHAMHVGAKLFHGLHSYAEYWRLVTAAISLATAIKLPAILEIALSVPSPRQLREANEAYAEELARRDDRESELEHIIDGLLLQISKHN